MGLYHFVVSIKIHLLTTVYRACLASFIILVSTQCIPTFCLSSAIDCLGARACFDTEQNALNRESPHIVVSTMAAIPVVMQIQWIDITTCADINQTANKSICLVDFNTEHRALAVFQFNVFGLVKTFNRSWFGLVLLLT